eukprot:5796757-Pleurochrysis_carterae.AAC.2
MLTNSASESAAASTSWSIRSGRSENIAVARRGAALAHHARVARLARTHAHHSTHASRTHASSIATALLHAIPYVVQYSTVLNSQQPGRRRQGTIYRRYIKYARRYQISSLDTSIRRFLHCLQVIMMFVQIYDKTILSI